MKKILLKSISLTLVLIFALTLTGCGAKTASGSIWDSALYTEDTTLGQGAKTLTVKVKAEEKEITFTVKTDKEKVGDALIENSLIQGEPGAYGLYVKKVNGITADYDVNQAFWAFYENGQYAMSGVDLTDINEGTVYSLEYTKG